MTILTRVVTAACVGILLTCAWLDESLAQSGVHVASYKLGFSGATVSIRETIRRWPIGQRTFILKGANGHTKTLPLHEGGGKIGNDSLNLFWGGSDHYFLTSERDCVDFDPVTVSATECAKRPPCDGGAVHGLTYVGRFDWMNGFDPPNGVFRFGFRFLTSVDAAESQSCPPSSMAPHH
jgi:hypothetical protein